MARKLRPDASGALHHVYARGNNRRDIYLDDADRRTYLALLGRVVDATEWRCLAYCLMPNHVHLLVETPRPNLAAGMQRLHGRYAQTFNARHGQDGHLFRGRYGSVLVTDDQQLATTVGYIAVNPVAAGLCDGPETWPWSSHVATASGAGPAWLDVERLLALLSAWGGDPRATYAQLIEQRLGGV